MLAGRCALVTGSTGGLGEAVATHLAGLGCNIVLNGFGEAAAIAALRGNLEDRFGIQVIHHGADLARPAEISDMIAAAGRFGGVDILVNNAVVRHFAPVDTFPVERWDEALAVNLSAAFHTIRLVLPRMRERNWGRIVNMSSVYGFFATANRVDYVTTKTALLGLTRAVAMDTAGANITCNALCPGTVDTPAILDRIRGIAVAEGMEEDAAARRYLAERQPTGRFVKAENVAALVGFLCSSAGADITGAALPIDGGWIAS